MMWRKQIFQLSEETSQTQILFEPFTPGHSGQECFGLLQPT